MSPVFFISLPFVLLFLMSHGAGAHQSTQTKKPQASEYEDGDIIIIRKQSKKKS